MQSGLGQGLVRVRVALAPVAAQVHDLLSSGAASDADVVDALRVGGELQRLVESVIAAAAGEVDARSQGPREQRFTTRHGVRNAVELVRAATRCDARSASAFSRAGKLTHRDASITTGELLPGAFPELGAALRAGSVTVAGFLAATRPLEQARARIAPRVLAQADAALAAAACGRLSGEAGSAAVPALDADDLGYVARRWVAYGDPDGAEPSEDEAQRRRWLSLGRARRGLVPVRGELLPDVAGQLVRLMDAITNPRRAACAGPAGSDASGGADGSDQVLLDTHESEDSELLDADTGGGDTGDADSGGGDGDMGPRIGGVRERSAAQHRHDALAAILNLAASSSEAGTIGGAPPTLVVTMTANDFARGSGWAHLDGIDAPTSFSAAARIACTGSIQRVLHNDAGRVLAIHTIDRVFNAHQRRAITARDRECIITGCHVPAAWCEIHHVHEAARGGATHTDNGVLLCWHHHRTLAHSGWEIRMSEGLPEIRGPGWWDTDRGWQPTPTPLATPNPLARSGQSTVATSG